MLALVSGATVGIRAAREEAVVELVLHTLLDKEGKEEKYGREKKKEIENFNKTLRPRKGTELLEENYLRLTLRLTIT